jgi:hypothetical protein
MGLSPQTPFTMAGLDPATQLASVSERQRVFFRRADARLLGGRLKGGHGELGKTLR